MEQVIPKSLTDLVVSSKDWVRGKASGVTQVTRVSDGNWTPYLPNYEPQKFKFDTNECSQLSGINCAETQCNYLKANNLLSQEALDFFTSNGYFDENGRFDFSERFTAILAGCSINGGSQWSFWQTISKYGLLPWNDLHYSMEESQVFLTQSDMCLDYYNPGVITDAMRQKALQALKYLQIQYEWINAGSSPYTSLQAIQDGLKQSPLHIGTPVCMGTWNSGNIQACGLTNVAHATMIYMAGNDGTKYIRDHYLPQNKTMSPDYPIPVVTLGYITPVPVVKDNWTYTFNTNLTFGMLNNPEVKQLQTALVKLGYLDPQFITGNYLGRTSDAVLQFQLDHNVAWSWILKVYMGHNFYSLTRTAMNYALSHLSTV